MNNTRHREGKAVTLVHRRVRDSLRLSGLADGARLVVAVSGGPDSLALLYSLLPLRDSIGLRLHGAHLDHRLRGAASEADAAAVRDTFCRLDIPATVRSADVEQFRRAQGLSLEDAARRVRYEFLAAVAAEQRADAVALGHTADDQAETVLMHILRGS
ncbi:MAG: tRNA lysidine(34) synthetase TilS, partial [Chloroflexi bacterium]|nr:tRNA lysidine(34) synthetase TilS [Chloroflexota bacterium]